MIKITKDDDGGNPIASIGFTLYNADKTKIVRAEELTDAVGNIVFDKLKFGMYLNL